jgi:hypothetical protein
MIQSYVSRFRNALGTQAREPGRRDGLLTSAGESYLLQMRTEQLDAGVRRLGRAGAETGGGRGCGGGV